MFNILLPSLIGLIGVIIGIIVTSILSFKIKTKETKLRIIEKVFDKRITAHENILTLIKNVRSVISTNQIDEKNHLITFPSFMLNRESFERFINDVYLISNLNNHWLNIELERELGFLVDYITTLNLKLKDVNEQNYPQVGLIVKQDFIDLATNLENITFEFFRKDIYKMKINKHNEWHKYQKEETLNRFHKTNLFIKDEEITSIREE